MFNEDAEKNINEVKSRFKFIIGKYKLFTPEEEQNYHE